MIERRLVELGYAFEARIKKKHFFSKEEVVYIKISYRGAWYMEKEAPHLLAVVERIFNKELPYGPVE